MANILHNFPRINIGLKFGFKSPNLNMLSRQFEVYFGFFLEDFSERLFWNSDLHLWNIAIVLVLFGLIHFKYKCCLIEICYTHSKSRRSNRTYRRSFLALFPPSLPCTVFMLPYVCIFCMSPVLECCFTLTDLMWPKYVSRVTVLHQKLVCPYRMWTEDLARNLEYLHVMHQRLNHTETWPYPNSHTQ